DVVQRLHVSRVEHFLVRNVERRWNVSEVEVDGVALCRGVNSVKIADALGSSQGIDSAHGDRHRASLGACPVGIEASIAKNVRNPLTRRCARNGYRGRVEE